MIKKGNKVVIIGAGFVGSTIGFTLMHSSLVSEMTFIDINEEKALGEVMDLNHGVSFLKHIDIKVGDYSDCKDADLIIISGGPSIKPGETRLDLARKNSIIIQDMMKNITKYTTDAVILIVSNPVDILTYVAAKSCGYDPKKIIGSGTVLDSSRFRYILSELCNVDPRNIHGYIIGEHGDSELAAWSLTNIGGATFENVCPVCVNKNSCELDKDKILSEVRDAGYEVLKRKGATYYGVAIATRRIAEAILRNENAILTVSSVLNGEYSIEGVALSVPTIVNRNGIHKITELPLSKEELYSLKESATKLKDIIKDLDTY